MQCACVLEYSGLKSEVVVHKGGRSKEGLLYHYDQ